jgi:hypothetical protein
MGRIVEGLGVINTTLRWGFAKVAIIKVAITKLLYKEGDQNKKNVVVATLTS